MHGRGSPQLSAGAQETVDVIELGLLVVVAAVCAAVGQFISGASRGGCPVSFAVALIGGYVVPRIARWQELAEPFTITIVETEFPVVWSAVGAFVPVLIVNFLTRGRRF